MAPLLAIGGALWLGILTAISPCPLASNIAAISWISRRVDRPRAALLQAVLYTAGRSVTYVAIAAVLVTGLLAAPGVSRFLERHVSAILGPLLVLVGLLVLGWVRLPFTGGGVAAGAQRAVERAGALGSLLLGALLALSFCPVSAALYFGSLLPLAVEHSSPVLLPAAYGIGTAVPVVAFALVVILSARSLGAWFRGTTAVERWARPVTGAVLIAVGVYLSLRHVYGVL
jgi:cytochrome c biogenesis protein CcdA